MKLTEKERTAKIATMVGALICAVLCGCGKPEEARVTDQCLRQELFKQCMAVLPKGPERVGAAANDDAMKGEKEEDEHTPERNADPGANT